MGHEEGELGKCRSCHEEDADRNGAEDIAIRHGSVVRQEVDGVFRLEGMFGCLAEAREKEDQGQLYDLWENRH